MRHLVMRHLEARQFLMRHWFVAAWLWMAASSTVVAQFDGAGATKGAQLGESFTQNYRVGVVVSAKSGPCKGIVATVPVPIAWPEQQVEILDEEQSNHVRRVRYRMVGGTVRQLLVEIPQLPAGAEARAIVTLKITRRTQLPPKDNRIFVIPKRLPRDVSIYLSDSPYIESRNKKIRSLAKRIVADKEHAWDQVEAIYDWVRENVEYKNGPLKGALAALRDGNGDCEELSSLFIALCRANKIPARTVWVPGHCYPEFYLTDDENKGHWIPCQAAGDRSFGGIHEKRPILQKGDNFRVPERPRDRQRYVAEFLTGKGGKPSVTFIREMVDDK